MRSVFTLLLSFIFACCTYGQWTIYNSTNSPLPDNTIRAIEFDQSGNTWIGTDKGLAKFDGTNWTVLDSSNSGLPVNEIRSIAVDVASRLWVGTMQAGFAIYNGINWVNYNTTNSLLADDQVRCISFDTQDSAWLGTSGGVVYLSDEGWINYNMFNSPLMANNITRIFVDRQNVKWMGTINGGMGKKEGNSWSIYNTGNSGLVDNTVLDIETDRYNNIWFTTPAHGLGRFDGSNWFYRLDANSSIPTNSITCLEIIPNTDVKYLGSANKGLIRWNNGLVFDSFTVNNSPIPDNNVTCLKRAPDGKFWIGTATGGVAVFTDTTVFAPVNIEGIAEQSTLTVYPNPVTDRLLIDNIKSGLSEIEITSLLGNLVIKAPVTSDKIEIHVGNLPPGWYVVLVKGNDYKQIAKFVKQ